jgi:hypothetical protein
MKLLVIHLSDLHLVVGENAAKAKFDHIAPVSIPPSLTPIIGRCTNAVVAAAGEILI